MVERDFEVGDHIETPDGRYKIVQLGHGKGGEPIAICEMLDGPADGHFVIVVLPDKESCCGRPMT